MSMIFHHETPSVPLLENLMKRVNAYGSEPRVLIELDKMVYVPGVKARFDIVEWVFNQQMRHVKGQEAPNPALTEPPNAPSSGNQGEPIVGTERFNYIKCAISKACDQWGLGIE